MELETIMVELIKIGLLFIPMILIICGISFTAKMCLEGKNKTEILKMSFISLSNMLNEVWFFAKEAFYILLIHLIMYLLVNLISMRMREWLLNTLPEWLLNMPVSVIAITVYCLFLQLRGGRK